MRLALTRPWYETKRTTPPGGRRSGEIWMARLPRGMRGSKVDMGVIGKQRDQGEEQGGKNRDPALTVKSQN
jgi:hypothetical protein